MTDLPLARFSVLDLTLHRAGPACVRQLADWGAQVLKIEAPGGAKGDVIGADRRIRLPEPAPQQTQHDLELLKNEEGRRIFLKLAERADVIIENYRSDVKHRLGIDYEAVARINPRIIYGSISGFGQADLMRPDQELIRSPRAWAA